MNWTGMLTRYGCQTEVAGQAVDPFTVLSAHANGQPSSKVACTVGTSREYGETKIAFTVSIECPQNEACINMAAEMVFRKGLELTNDAASQLGIPGLPPFTEP